MAIPAQSRLPPSALRTSVSILLARLRFPLLVGIILGLLAAWPYLRNAFDKWTTIASKVGSISADTEFWCPMCPGVLSEWPSKCPVCNMSLVKRQKGEMTPLPDGVVARVQLSPYRIQLAGLRTAPVEYRKLMAETKVGGLLVPPNDSWPQWNLYCHFPDSVTSLKIGHPVDVTVDNFDETTFPGRILEFQPQADMHSRLWIVFDRVHPDFQRGQFARAIVRQPWTAFPTSRMMVERTRVNRIAVAGFADVGSTLGDAVVHHLAVSRELALSVPAEAVIETGTTPIVYTVSMPGVYDAVEVQLGRRCGEFYVVHGGLEAGQQVVTAGSVLLDAETRLNPSVAASYFGASRRSNPATPLAGPAIREEDDATLIAKQKICPVTDEPLGSMGPPVRVSVAGRTVFVCCKGCEKPLVRKPDEYLAKLPK